MDIILPAIREFVKNRPYRGNFEEHCFIPNADYSDFWDEIYTIIRAYGINSPIEQTILKYINPNYGFFGLRTHPVTGEKNYFHTGISLELDSGTSVYPILPGILEYSGYGAINGYYVLLSHPQIQTEDGYTLHSMYCHLKKPLVKFSSYEKILREVSLRSHPQKKISLDILLGQVSTSGLVIENHPELYLQLSFRKFDKDAIMINPINCYQEGNFENNMN